MKTEKKVMIGILAGILCAGTSFSAMAGSWQSDAVGWWWREDSGGYPVNGWQWIDGDRDGTAECYYFDHNGYCLIDTVTPDGYQVDSGGAWVMNGTVQRQTVSLPREDISESVDWKLRFIADQVFQKGEFYRRGGGNPVKSKSLSVSDLSSDQKASVLYAYQYNCSDRRITDGQNNWIDTHQALASDMREIMREIFGTATDNDMESFEKSCAGVEGNVYYMYATGDFGDADPYWLSSDNMSAVIENGQLKLSGNVVEYSAWDTPVKQFEAYFVPQSGSCLDGYRFDRVIVR